ncbi:hypothetical protein ACNAUY_07895 [Acinetobacter tibetensis]|uniref:hypothetical protein n=1 Tax=Acinetobacter tibetensis TaxID=2943497 RepID=UPI003A4D5657
MCQCTSKATDPSTQPARTETGDLQLKPSLNRDVALYKAATALLARQEIALTENELDYWIRVATDELAATDEDSYKTKPIVVATRMLVDIAKKHVAKARTDAANSGHAEGEVTLVIENTHNIKIKPFATLEDIVTSGHKFTDILFPGRAQDPRDYELSVINSAAALAAVPAELKFEALTSLLGLVLLGYQADQLNDAKDLLRAGLEDAIHTKVKATTTQALGAFGLQPAA